MSYFKDMTEQSNDRRFYGAEVKKYESLEHLTSNCTAKFAANLLDSALIVYVATKGDQQLFSDSLCSIPL